MIARLREWIPVEDSEERIEGSGESITPPSTDALRRRSANSIDSENSTTDAGGTTRSSRLVT